MKNLYLITTKSYGDYYVIADNTLEAEETIGAVLDTAGFHSRGTMIVNIKFISANALSSDASGNPKATINEYTRLIIAEQMATITNNQK